MNEAKIIKECREGHHRAQKMLFDIFSEMMLAVCIRYVKNKADAEELMLNGFYKFFTQINKFIYSGEGSITPWLKKIMINECLMFLRKRGQLIMMNDKLTEEASVDAGVLAKMGAEDLFEHITALPSGCRTVFNLFVIEEMSHKEIAFILGISEGASKSQLNKARLRLQNMIKQTGEHDERFR